MGWQSSAVEIRNIVVGDLPFDGLGDFYLSIDCAHNPAMVTSIQEEKHPKVVHFPEILTLKIRNSFLEPRVKITVKELNALGSNELCVVNLSSEKLVDWAEDENPNERTKRFTMRPCDYDIERATPAWILLEFATADDVREIEGMKHGNYKEVRAWVPSAEATNLGAAPLFHGEGNTADPWREGPRQVVSTKLQTFKKQYYLLDDTGNPMSEPSEDELARYERMRKSNVCCLCMYQFIIVLIVVGYCVFRFYVWSCYRHFKWVTIAKLREEQEAQKTGADWRAKFPMSTATMHDIVKFCHNAVRGTGVPPGESPCRPSPQQIGAVCRTPPPGKRPGAFTVLLHNWFAIEWDGSKLTPCFNGLCAFRDKLVEWDWTIAALCVFLVISTFFLRCCLQDRITSARRHDQQSRIDGHKEIIKRVR
jgi:hypothetical protein